MPFRFARLRFASGFPLAGSVADFDFRNARYSGPALSVANSTGGYVDNAAGNWSLVPPNTLRRSDKGLLVEGAQTNSIRNNSMQGAIAGSPGTLPTNWTQLTLGAGLARTIVGTGTLAGVDYVDIRFTGTPTSSTGGAFFIEPPGAVAATQGQLWTYSSFAALIGGSLANVVNFRLNTDYRDNASTVLLTSAPATPITASLTRFTVPSITAPANTVSTTAGFRFDATANQPIDFTIRIGWPQLERWDTAVTTVGGASSPIRTTGAAATRAADLVSFGAQAFDGRQGTFVATTRAGDVIPSSATIIGLNNSANTASAARMRVRGIPSETGLAATGDGVNFVTSASGTISTGLRFGYAFAWAVNDAQIAKDGALSGSAGTVQNPPAALGNGLIGSGAGPWGGYIERVSILPYRVSNPELVNLSTLGA